MIIACPNCSTRFKLDAARIPSKGAKVRCAQCSHVWLLQPAEPPARKPKPKPQLAPEPFVAAPVEPPEPDEQEEEPEASDAQFEFPSRRAERVERVREPAHTYTPGATSYAAEEESSTGVGRWALRAGWALLLVFVVAGLSVGYFMRLDVVRAFPKTAALYDLLGLDINVVGIDFRNVTAESSVSNGAPSLQLEGEIVNKSGHRVAVPELLASLRDAKGRELSHWTFEAFADSLGPREVSAFASPHVPIPAGAKELELRFATPK